MGFLHVFRTPYVGCLIPPVRFEVTGEQLSTPLF